VGASGRALNFPVGRFGMRVSRRKFTAVAASAVAITASVPLVGEPKIYGRIGRMTTAPEKRDELIVILLGATSSMPGCLSYIVAQDPTNSDAILDSQSSHKASLSLPSVKDAISRGKVLITGFDKPIETVPVGGYGLHAAT
jgi:quinol monooxygenase YgiN